MAGSKEIWTLFRGPQNGVAVRICAIGIRHDLGQFRSAPEHTSGAFWSTVTAAGVTFVTAPVEMTIVILLACVP